MEMIIMLAVIAALIALVYWKMLKTTFPFLPGKDPKSRKLRPNWIIFPKRPAGMPRFITAAFCATAFLLI